MSEHFAPRGILTVRDCPESRKILDELERRAHNEWDFDETPTPGMAAESPPLAGFAVNADANVSNSEPGEIHELLTSLVPFMPKACSLTWGDDEEGIAWYGTPEQIEAGKKARRIDAACEAFKALTDAERQGFLAAALQEGVEDYAAEVRRFIEASDAKRAGRPRVMHFGWSVADVRAIRPDLPEDQAWAVLQAVRRRHDADVGVNWRVIESVAAELFPPEPITVGTLFIIAPATWKQEICDDSPYKVAKVTESGPGDDLLSIHADDGYEEVAACGSLEAAKAKAAELGEPNPEVI